MRPTPWRSKASEGPPGHKELHQQNGSQVISLISRHGGRPIFGYCAPVCSIVKWHMRINKMNTCKIKLELEHLGYEQAHDHQTRKTCHMTYVALHADTKDRCKSSSHYGPDASDNGVPPLSDPAPLPHTECFGEPSGVHGLGTPGDASGQSVGVALGGVPCGVQRFRSMKP